MNADGVQKFSAIICKANENSSVDKGNSGIRPTESVRQVSTSSSRHQQDSPSLVQREIERPKIYLLRGHIGGDLSPNPDLPTLEECLDKLIFEEAEILSNSENPEDNIAILLPEFFINPILNMLNFRVLVEKHPAKDECVHLAAAMCNALGEEHEHIVGCCASATHNLGIGFIHSLYRFTEALTKLNQFKSLDLYQARQDVLDGLNTDRQTLVEKIAHREIARVNTILQQGSSIEDKYKPVGDLALIFFALSANKRQEASQLFQEACFKDADGNKITQSHPVHRKEATTDPADTCQYVYSSVRRIKDITHLQRLVDQIKNHLVPEKGAAAENPELVY